MNRHRCAKRAEGEDDGMPVVPFVPFRCPRCGRHKPYTHAVHGRLRWHVCRACGQRYKSLEATADKVIGFHSDSAN